MSARAQPSSAQWASRARQTDREGVCSQRKRSHVPHDAAGARGRRLAIRAAPLRTARRARRGAALEGQAQQAARHRARPRILRMLQVPVARVRGEGAHGAARPWVQRYRPRAAVQHLQSAQHRSFVANEKNWADLDALILRTARGVNRRSAAVAADPPAELSERRRVEFENRHCLSPSTGERPAPTHILASRDVLRRAHVC